MSSYLDLLSGQEENRYTSALALLLQLEPAPHDLLRGLLEIAQDAPNLPGAERLTTWDLEAGIRAVEVSVQESCRGGPERGVFDLVVRFQLDRRPCLLAVEVKFAAHGEHGRQLRTYRRQVQAWTADEELSGGNEGNAVLALLLLDDPATFFWSDPDRDRPAYAHAWRWRDVRTALAQALTGWTGDATLHRLGTELLLELADRTRDLTDRRHRLQQADSHYPYPLLLDAVKALARELCGGVRLNPQRRGGSGAMWSEESGRFFAGYWWWLPGEKRWASLNVYWESRDRRDPARPEDEAAWFPRGGGSGHHAWVRLGRGPTPEGRDVSRPLRRFSLDRFVEQLTEDGVEELLALLSAPEEDA